MSAFSCRPGSGSEPGAGWAFARAAAEHHDVWLLTRRRDKELLDAAIQAHPGLSLTPVHVDVHRRLQTRRGGGPRLYLHYLAWQATAAARARALHAEIGFDVGHHVTFSNDWLPTPLVAVRGLPLVWGPVGGYAPLPWQLTKWLGWKGTASELLRAGLTGLLREVFGEFVARRAALVVANNTDVAARFRGSARHVLTEPHTAAEGGSESGPIGQEIDNLVADQTNGNRRALFVGRVLPWKGLALAVAALARPEARRWTLDVVGTGPDITRVTRLAARLGVSHRVRFLGQVEHTRVLDMLARVDALLQPSMHDSGGFAVAEAVALGCPVVCLDRGGPAVIVTDATTKAPVTIHADRDLARILATLDGRHERTNRWSGDRLVHCCDLWYLEALTSPKRPSQNTRDK